MGLSVNSTLPNHLSSNHSAPKGKCSWSNLDINILTAFYITNILLLLPLSALILYVGLKRWQHQRSNPAATTSHSDIFTYHMMTMEMILLVASVVFCIGYYAKLADLMEFGYEVFSSAWCAKMSFHSLTCVERYLAVVHPVLYLQFKNDGGVRIRNICIACVWLLCILWALLVALTTDEANMILYFCFMGFSLAVVCFCSLSVLYVLRRPGPGEAGGDKKQMDQMKQKAFHTILIITGVLFVCFGGMLACDALEASMLLQRRVGCAVLTSAVWFSLPGSLVLPLLFLHRADTLSCCRRKAESG